MLYLQSGLSLKLFSTTVSSYSFNDNGLIAALIISSIPSRYNRLLIIISGATWDQGSQNITYATLTDSKFLQLSQLS